MGNPMRRDDGVARRVLQLVGPVAGVATLEVMQLQPENAAEIAGYDRVVFVDADLEAGEPRIETLAEEGSPSPLGHSLSPAEIVALSRRLFGFRGQALVCRIPGVDFSLGYGLSGAAEGNSIRAAELLRQAL